MHFISLTGVIKVERKGRRFLNRALAALRSALPSPAAEGQSRIQRDVRGENSLPSACS